MQVLMLNSRVSDVRSLLNMTYTSQCTYIIQCTLVGYTLIGCMLVGCTTSTSTPTRSTKTPILSSDSPQVACTLPLSLGDRCTTERDCCEGSQLRCVAIQAGESRCVSTCEISPDGGQSSCLSRELCTADPSSRDVNLGICISGDSCEPSQLQQKCDAQLQTCQRIQNITLCVDTTHIQDFVPHGEPCDLEQKICDRGLVCEYGYCRTLCDEEECPSNERCLDYSTRLSGVDYRFCMPTCNLFTQDCDSDQACIIVGAHEEQLLTECTTLIETSTTETSSTFPPMSNDTGEPCTTNEEYYWGSCDPSHLCTHVTRELAPGQSASSQSAQSASSKSAPSCTPICDALNLSHCTAPQACVFNLFSLRELGICLGECDALTNSGCTEDQQCMLTHFGQRLNNQGLVIDAAIGTCVSSPTLLSRTGQLCQPNPSNNTGNCEVGNVCVQITADASSICLPICHVSQEEGLCSEGTCRALSTFTPDGSDVFGICL